MLWSRSVWTLPPEEAKFWSKAFGDLTKHHESKKELLIWGHLKYSEQYAEVDKEVVGGPAAEADDDGSQPNSLDPIIATKRAFDVLSKMFPQDRTESASKGID